MIRTYRTLAIRAIVWSQLVIMAAMIASGSIFSAGVLLSAPQVISGVEPIASTFAEVLIYGFTILFVYVMIARVVRRRMLSRAPTREGIRERLQRLGAEVSSRMSVRREVVFVVGRGGSNAYVRKKRIVVGEKLLL